MAVVINPIPKDLLIHEAVLSDVVLDIQNREQLEPVAELKRIRIEPSDALTVTANGEQAKLSALLFFDCKNSLPKGQTFKLGQKVTFDGRIFEVVNVDKLYTFGPDPHHWEVSLI